MSVWKVIKEGYTGPTKFDCTIKIPKPKNEWDDDDYKKEGTHAKTINAIIYAVTFAKFKKIPKCTIAKAM